MKSMNPLVSVPYMLGSLADVLACLDSTEPQTLRQLGQLETQLVGLRQHLTAQRIPVMVRPEHRQRLCTHIDYLKVALSQVQTSARRDP